MAVNKWLRDYEATISRKHSRKRQHAKYVISEKSLTQIQSEKMLTKHKTLTWGEYFEPVERKHTMSIEAISGHRTRCKREIVNKTLPVSAKPLQEEGNSNLGETFKGSKVRPRSSHEPLSVRDHIYNTGCVGRTRPSSVLVQSIGSNMEDKHLASLPRVRSEPHRLKTFDLRMSEASTRPMKLSQVMLSVDKSPEHTNRDAESVQERAQKQKGYFEKLSQPRSVNEKVYTDGRDRTMWEELELKSSREPGPGQYNSELSLKALESPSGGRFNLSKPKSDIEWTIKRSSDVPDPGSYSLSPPKLSGGKFNLSEPLSDIELKILRSKDTPGPNEYLVSPSKVKSGGKFNQSKPKSDLDWTIYNAQFVPGPGEYQVKSPDPRGGRFNESRPLSDVDVVMKRASLLPGPGEYASPNSKLSGGKFNMSNPKSDIDIRIYNAAQVPGPGDYIVKDDILRTTSHTGKFPFVYRPENVTLKKLASTVNTVRNVNRFKDTANDTSDIGANIFRTIDSLSLEIDGEMDKATEDDEEADV